MKKNLLFVIVMFVILIVGSLLLIQSTSFKEVTRKPAILTPAVTPTPSIDPEANITITTPTAGESVSSPLTVTGSARVFESTLEVRVKDETGKVLIEKTVMANSPDVGQFGPYTGTLIFNAPKGKRGTVEALSYSAKDGSEINLVSIPVTFAP